MSAVHGDSARSGEVRSRLCGCRGAGVRGLRCVAVVGIVEDGKAVWANIFASEIGHAGQRVVTGELRWLFGQHLGLALSTLELGLLLLLLLPGFGTSSQHVGSSFS